MTYGLKLGFNYDSIIKSCFHFGVDFNFSKEIVFSVGVMYRPNAYNKSLDKLNDKENTNYTKGELSLVLVGFRPFFSFLINFGKE